MRFQFLALVFALNCLLGAAQKHDAVWVFGDSVGINYNNPDSTFLISPPTCMDFEDNISFSDSSGNLLFYITGDLSDCQNPHSPSFAGTMLDFGYVPAINGQGLFSYISEVQGGVALPNHLNTRSGLYFYSLQFTLGNPSNGIYYSIAACDSAGCTLTVKNHALINTDVSERIAAVKHANGMDWFIIGQHSAHNRFYKFLYSNATVGLLDSQIIGRKVFDYSCFNKGQMKFSPEGDKLAFVSWNGGRIDLFDFDRCSGVLDNWI